MSRKILLFAPAAFDLAETTRMVEIAKAILHHKEANKIFYVQFISNGGEFEHLIREEKLPLELLRPRLTENKMEFMGNVADEIVRQSTNAKLVTFGKKGFHKPGEMSHLGENFHQFIHRIQVPFIASNLELRPVQNILLGFNGSIPSNRALRWAEKISETFQTRTYVAYVMEGDHDDENAKRVEKGIQESRLNNCDWVLLQGDPIHELAKTVINFGIDLLIVARGDHTMKLDLVKGSTLDRLLRDIHVTTLFG
jgi:nucleotide-binding universal stress UspA family protein